MARSKRGLPPQLNDNGDNFERGGSLQRAIQILRDPPLSSSSDVDRVNRAAQWIVQTFISSLSREDGLIRQKIAEIRSQVRRDQVYYWLLWPLPDGSNIHRKNIWPLAFLILLAARSPQAAEIKNVVTTPPKGEGDADLNEEHYDNVFRQAEIYWQELWTIRDLLGERLIVAAEWLQQLRPKLGLAGREVLWGAQKCTVTAMQAKFLDKLLKHRGHFVSATDLEAASGFNCASDALSDLKKKLNAKGIALAVTATSNPLQYRLEDYIADSADPDRQVSP